MGRRGVILLLSVSPCPRVRRLLLDLFRFPYSITHFVKRSCDCFQIGSCVLKPYSESVVCNIGFDLFYSI